MKIIVGIDPGTNVGLAIFDLNKNLIFIKTLRRAGKNEVIKEIEKIGRPVVVSTDVKELPPLVKKVASYFNSKIFYPDREITSLEKAKLFDEFLSKYQEKLEIKKINLHERDAIVAVVKFFRKIENKLRWAERIIEEKRLKDYEEEIKSGLIQGEKLANIIKRVRKE